MAQVLGIVKSSGSPVYNAFVEIGSASCSTDSNGNFSLSVENGTYNFSVIKEGYAIYVTKLEVDGDKNVEISLIEI